MLNKAAKEEEKGMRSAAKREIKLLGDPTVREANIYLLRLGVI